MNSPRAPRATLWLTLLLTAGTALAACGTAAEAGTNQTPTPALPADPRAGNDGAGDGSGGGAPGQAPGGGGGNLVNPDQPIGGAPPPAAQDPWDGALRVEPEPGIINATPHAWDHITVASDGRTVTIYYWGGIQDCYGLAGVDVERDADGRLRITVMEGQRGDLGPNTACIEIALLKAVTVTLDEPIVAPAD